MVFVDHAAEHLSPTDWCLQRHDDGLTLVGWSLLAGLMGPVPVVVADVAVEDQSQVPFAVDQHPVGALGSCGAHPPFGVAVGPHRQLHLIRRIGTDVSV